MDQVYNYMTDSYLPKPAVKNCTHRTAELKKIYITILKLSRTAPLYRIDLSPENQIYTFNIKEAAITLKARISEILDPESLCFKQKTIKVSNPEVLSAELVNNETGNFKDTITVSVHELAKPQVNIGKDLYAGSHNLGRGIHEFGVRIKDRSYDLAFDQTDKNDNRNTLDAIAGYLNNVLPQITAAVEDGESKGFIHMVLKTDFTGKFGDRSLTLEDLEQKREGLVNVYGLDRVEQEGSDARFSVNHMKKSSGSNSFILDDTIKISLHDVSDQPVILQLITDSRPILEQLDLAIGTFNDLIRYASEKKEDAGDHSGAGKLINELKIIEKSYMEELQSCGLRIEENGTLMKDEMLSAEASQEGVIEKFFKRKDGFIAAVLKKTDEISVNPIDYSDKTLITYPNCSRFVYINPYISSMYSGLLFNSYC